jgi:hypothetical protein
MTADMINLNKARKARARQAEKAKAVQNRALFGRSKAQIALEKTRAEQARQVLDNARREPADGG